MDIEKRAQYYTPSQMKTRFEAIKRGISMTGPGLFNWIAKQKTENEARKEKTIQDAIDNSNKRFKEKQQQLNASAENLEKTPAQKTTGKTSTNLPSSVKKALFGTISKTTVKAAPTTTTAPISTPILTSIPPPEVKSDPKLVKAVVDLADRVEMTKPNQPRRVASPQKLTVKSKM